MAILIDVDMLNNMNEHCIRSIICITYTYDIRIHFRAYTLRSFFPFWKIIAIGYANDSTLMAVVPYQGVKVTVAESLIVTLAGFVNGVTFGDEIVCE